MEKEIMKWNDRMEALKRSEQYRKDYEEYEKWGIEKGINEAIVVDAFEQKMSGKTKILCAKYHIPFPIDPDRTEIYDPNWKVIGSMKEEMKTPAVKVNRARLGESEKYSHSLWDGQFVTMQLTIDTSKTQQDIEDEFRVLYQYLLTQGPGKKRSPRTGVTYQGKEIDHWLVFDMMKEKKNKSRVMKELFGITENPTYDKESRARYNQVDRYYKKALRLLQDFESK
jgi:hypothetical protein